MFTLAQTFAGLLSTTESIIVRLTGILFVVGTAVFLWGVIQYMIAAGDEKKIKDARQKITYGIIGLFMMVAMWGIVRVIVNTFGLNENIGPPNYEVLYPEGQLETNPNR